MSGAHVAILVLNYNGWENTRDCLESVMALEYAGLSLFVVDNGSRDGEAGKIDRWLSGVSESREEMGAVGLDEPGVAPGACSEGWPTGVPIMTPGVVVAETMAISSGNCGNGECLIVKSISAKRCAWAASS